MFIFLDIPNMYDVAAVSLERPIGSVPGLG